MADSRLIAFKDNFSDNSTEEGFEFTFFCEVCNEGYKSRFIESSTYQKASFFRGVSRAISVGASLLGHGYALGQGADAISERFQGMTPDWHREHQDAFKLAQEDASGHFHRCPKCRKIVCPHDWNEQDGLCVECAPRADVEIAAARAARRADEIRETAATTNVFRGKIEAKTTLCPTCGKPAGEGKFCTNCGANLSQVTCSKCNSANAPGTKFCSECGNKLS